MTGYLYILAAAVPNLAAIYCLKASMGMSKLWPSLALIVTIVLAQWMVSLAMQTGMPMVMALLLLNMLLLTGTAAIGWLNFGETLTPGQMAGFVLALSGITLMKLA